MLKWRFLSKSVRGGWWSLAWGSAGKWCRTASWNHLEMTVTPEMCLSTTVVSAKSLYLWDSHTSPMLLNTRVIISERDLKRYFCDNCKLKVSQTSYCQFLRNASLCGGIFPFGVLCSKVDVPFVIPVFEKEMPKYL